LFCVDETVAIRSSRVWESPRAGGRCASGTRTGRRFLSHRCHR